MQKRMERIKVLYANTEGARRHWARADAPTEPILQMGLFPSRSTCLEGLAVSRGQCRLGQRFIAAVAVVGLGDAGMRSSARFAINRPRLDGGGGALLLDWGRTVHAGRRRSWALRQLEKEPPLAPTICGPWYVAVSGRLYPRRSLLGHQLVVPQRRRVHFLLVSDMYQGCTVCTKLSTT
jgi:hypothetical protein